MRKLTLFLFLIFLIPSVHAQLLAVGEPTIQGTPCVTTNGTITLQNTGSEATTYSVSVDGSGSDFAAFSAITFALEPGQTAPLRSFYTIPCTTSPGTYDLNIYFTDGNEELVLEQDIVVTIPDNIDANITPTSNVIGPCETATYDISLANPLSFNEIYTLAATGHPNVHLTHPQVILTGGESQNAQVTVSPDDCTQTGNYPLTLTITTDKSKQQEEYALELIITSTDIPVLADGISTIRTDYTDSSAELTIQNTGDRITTYQLSAQGAPWATITPERASLNPGETQTVLLRFNPDRNVPKGTYPITFAATVDSTGIVYSKNLAVKLGPPTLLETNPALFIALIIIVIAVLIGLFYFVKYIRSPHFKQQRKHLNAKLAAMKKARAERRKKRAEAREKKRARKLEQHQKKLERKQKERERAEKRLERKVTKQLKKSHYLVHRKDTVKGTHKRSFLRIAVLALALLIILLIASAWSLISANLSSVGLGILILAVIFIAKRLARCKVVSTHWKLLLAKHPVTVTVWKNGLSRLRIVTDDPVKNFRILVKKTKPAVTPSPTIYQTVTVKTNANAELNATFTIPTRWLTKHGVKASDVRLAKHTGNRWTGQTIKPSGEGKNVLYFNAQLKPGTYSIYVKPKKKKPSHKRNIILGLVGLAAVIILAVALAPQPQTIAHGIPPQVWPQDSVHKLNLAPYFTDPDGDQLTYNATPTEHITIEIAGNTAYFTPDNAWTGNERVVFTAHDGKGGTITSNSVPLRVQRHIIPHSAQPYIALVLAVLAILLLLWTVKQLQYKR